MAVRKAIRAISIVLQAFWLKPYPQELPGPTRSSNITQSSNNTIERATRPPRRSHRTSLVYRNAKQKDPKRRKLSAAVARAKITKHLDKLHDEQVELQARWEEYFEDFEDANIEHEELAEALQGLKDVLSRDIEIQAEEETIVAGTPGLFHLRQQQRKKTTPKSRKHEHPLAARRRHDLEKKLHRALYRRNLAKIQLEYADALRNYIRGGIKIQERERDETEDGEEKELDFDEHLAGVLERERMLRREARAQAEQGDRPSPTTNRVYYPPPLPRRDREARRTRAKHQERAVQQVEASRQPTQTTRSSRVTGRVDDGTTEHFGRLSLGQQPTAPYCGGHMWAPKSNADTSCARCGHDVSGVVYCCTKCHAEICIGCFQRAQPEGAETGVSKFIFSTGDHAKV